MVVNAIEACHISISFVMLHLVMLYKIALKNNETFHIFGHAPMINVGKNGLNFL
jgi:hypothetical protein